MRKRNFSELYQILVNRSKSVLSRISLRKSNCQSFSQFGEDAILEKYLPESSGRYLDIGSGHPILGSNTYLLYRRGWTGTLIEPIQSLAALSSRIRARDTVINKVVSKSTHPVNFYEFNPYQYSTTSVEYRNEKVLKGIKLKAEYLVQTISVDDLRMTVEPLDPFLLSIDCEGEDFAVLESINFSLLLPRVICIEDLGWSFESSKESEVFKLLRANNYTLRGIAFPSLVFVHNHYLDRIGG